MSAEERSDDSLPAGGEDHEQSPTAANLSEGVPGAHPSEIPDDPPARGGGEAAVPDQPLGVPADADPDDAGLPGIPEREPPASG